MGIFKKNSKIATTDVSTKKSDDDMSQAEIVECIESCKPNSNK